ncbi:hypothetical protein ACRE_016650 [Hapsidospora chrysogenum ATCC 11550]|uniref:Uncharacterized protein n=1 Tax=Hapsidospora chrysogenum (strain ATCC 11550 / CBS 779.69 / DSM 880 / IAM 14645 / JCM 23072 / IMI 49137) TaxID=857340 RepID=A0A086TDW9_HAPC1|nr:hypothetical protein ACRE_016650 [Hapsidospora chrysogenum ATCC 11550]
MAFHQPTRQSVHRAVRLPTEERESPGARSQARPQNNEQLDQSQTSWVLFSPVTKSASASEFSEPTLSLQMPGRSRLNDVGSLHTETRSHQHGEDSVSTAASVAEDHLGEDDGEELDSLDSHLPSFRSLPVRASNSQDEQQHAAPVFPSHDGLGSFHLNNPMSGMEAQDQIYQFERFNPRRVRRRRESIERLQAEWDNEHAREAEKRQRIEAWRLEHSQVLLDEIQRETRRRRRSQASLRHVQTMSAASVGNQQSGDTGSSDNMTWHDEEAGVSMDEPEGMLSRFTQRVIKDLLGIDHTLLSILLGEAVPEDDELSGTPRASQINGQAGQPTIEDSSWQVQILERISRELGLLVKQISQHPGAFSTYAKVQHLPLPYAGLPVIPESSTAPATGEAVPSARSGQPPTMDFRPTISKPTPAIHIPGRPSESSTFGEDVNMSNAFTKDEWERDLDIKLVFRYIRSRFTSRASSSPQASGSHLGTTSGQDTSAKAARVRQHHPLISRPRATERRSFKVMAPSSPVALRHHSSCASQSTRRSARRSSCSSRHYWDIGGSLGTGSLIASNGPMGSWGEV